MKFDEYGLLIRESEVYPGNIGDSCAETFRLFILAFDSSQYTDNESYKAIDDTRTNTGFLRHPTAPEGWRESDFSQDQFNPRYMFCGLFSPVSKSSMTASIISGKYPNGNPLNPMTRYIRSKSRFWAVIAFLGQALLFKLPFRWSDSKRWFESNNDSSGDYLNWIVGLYYANIVRNTIIVRLTLSMFSKEYLLSKVQHYYRVEDNSDWIIKYYKEALDKLYAN